jgi:hypothetical protein
MNHTGARRRVVTASTSESHFSQAQASAPQGDDDVPLIVHNNPSVSATQVDNDEFLISSDARFSHVKNCLHLCFFRETLQQNPDDPIWKISGFLKVFQRNCRFYYTCSSDLSLDEMMLDSVEGVYSNFRSSPSLLLMDLK